jgi:hypothetical protein
VHDADLRVAMRPRLSVPSTRLVEEMGVYSGSARIDMAVIGADLHGIELKSDTDNLKRLPKQVELYNRLFDRMTLVVGKKHLAKALPMIPTWWAVIEAEIVNNVLILTELRAGSPNPRPDPKIIADLLWRAEILAALDARGLAKGWKAKRASSLRRRLISSVTLDELRGIVRETLRARPDWLKPIS